MRREYAVAEGVDVAELVRKDWPDAAIFQDYALRVSPREYARIITGERGGIIIYAPDRVRVPRTASLTLFVTGQDVLTRERDAGVITIPRFAVSSVQDLWEWDALRDGFANKRAMVDAFCALYGKEPQPAELLSVYFTGAFTASKIECQLSDATQ